MALWQDPQRKDWRWEFQFMGKRYTGSGYKTRRDALQAREEKRKEAKEQKESQLQIAMVFSEVASLYLDYSQRRHAKKGYNYKKLVYRRFLEAHGIYRPEDDNLIFSEITPQQILSFLSTRPSNRNYNAHRAELSALWTYAQNTLRIIDPRNNPFLFIQPLPHSPAERYIPPEQDVLKLINASHPETERPIILIILHTAARIDEVLRLKWQDINFEKREITLWTRKRRSGAYEADKLYMNDDLYNILMSLWKRRKQNAWVIYNERTRKRYVRRPKMMKNICKRAGINPSFGFHSLRHFVASMLEDEEKVGTKTISSILRHKNVRTTEIYLHRVDSRVKDALKKLEGRF
jgi:integrase